MNLNLQNQTVLITGASGGIGQSTAAAFAEEGAHLAIHYHTQPDAALALADRLDTQTLTVGADLRNESSIDQMFTEITNTFPRLDAVVINAGVWIAQDVPLHEMSLDQWRQTLDANLTSAFLTTRAFLRHLATVHREHAAITIVSSTAALFGEADHADYAASKSALTTGLTLSLKNEIVRLAPGGRVNCVCPGWTDTPMAAPAHTTGAIDRATATVPLRRIAHPDDIARAIVFLTSPTAARHITGAILPITGGMEGRLLNP